MPVPSNVGDLSPNPAGNSPTGNETVGPNLDDYLRAGFAFTRQIAVDFAGDTAPTNPVPYMRWADTANLLMKRRNAAGTDWVTEGVLLRSAVFNVPASNIPTSDAGAIYVDGIGIMVWDAGQYRSPVPATHCRLTLSGASLVLSPLGGNQLYIGGVNRVIPGAGVSLAATGLTVGTVYYIYAYWTGTAIALEASTTGHSTDASTGVEIKTGDATRTLVGMARPVTGPAWKDDFDNRYVLSWFNRQLKGSRKQLTANVSLSAAGPAEVSANLRNDFICWANGVASATASGAAQIGASSTYAFRLSLNGSAIGNWMYGANLLASNAATALGLTDLSPVVPEGANYITLAYTRGSGSGNADVTGTFNGNTNVQVQILG